MKVPLPPFRTLCRKHHATTRCLANANARALTAGLRSRRQSRRGYATTYVSAADLQFGQPVYETHPHILNPGECKFTLLLYI